MHNIVNKLLRKYATCECNSCVDEIMTKYNTSIITITFIDMLSFIYNTMYYDEIIANNTKFLILAMASFTTNEKLKNILNKKIDVSIKDNLRILINDLKKIIKQF